MRAGTGRAALRQLSDTRPFIAARPGPAPRQLGRVAEGAPPSPPPPPRPEAGLLRRSEKGGAGGPRSEGESTRRQKSRAPPQVRSEGRGLPEWTSGDPGMRLVKTCYCSRKKKRDLKLGEDEKS